MLVDSGYDTVSTLRCCECNNEEEFKIGKVKVETDEVTVNSIITQARKEAGIDK